jgi:hypothetical protein
VAIDYFVHDHHLAGADSGLRAGVFYVSSAVILFFVLGRGFVHNHGTRIQLYELAASKMTGVPGKVAGLRRTAPNR